MAQFMKWLKNNSTKLIPLFILALLTLFFIWRAIQLNDRFHIILAILYGIVILLAGIGKLSAQYQTHSLNIGVSIFFLDLVFTQLKLQDVATELILANWWLVIPSVIALLIHLVFRIWRWQWLLKPMGDISFGPAFRAGMIGIGGNMVLPARAGEFLRAYAIGRSCQISKTGAFATLVVERIFDGLTMLLILLGCLIYGVINYQAGLQSIDPDLLVWLRGIGLLGAAFYIFALVAVIIFMLRRVWVEKIIAYLLPSTLQEKILGLINAFASGLESLRDLKQLGMVTVYSLLTWAFIPLSFWPILLAFDFQAPIPFFAAVLMLPLLAFGLTIPGAPGGVGIFEGAALLSLVISFQLVGFPLLTDEQRAVAVACSVLVHISQAVPEALLGLWAFFAEGLTSNDLQSGRKM